jgi:hypothetical protein
MAMFTAQLREEHNLELVQADERLAVKLITARNWCDTMPHCSGNLGIPRNKMPQIKAPVMKDFLAYVKANGVGLRTTSVPAKNLKATQKEIIPAMVNEVLADQYHKRSQNRPVLASGDNYILDGHHRWAAWLVEDPNVSMKLVQIMAPIREVLELARNFPGVQYSTRTTASRLLTSRVRRMADHDTTLRAALAHLLG